MKQAINNPMTKLRIRFAYPWTKNTDARRDPRYQFLRRVIKDSGGNVLRRCQREISRLRAGHGNVVAESIFKCLEHTDILVADLTDQNPNVMLELGYAFALKRAGAIQHIFLFCEKNHAPGAMQKVTPPSDLAGFMVTYYRKVQVHTPGKPCYEVVDQLGFRTMFRALIGKIVASQVVKP